MEETDLETAKKIFESYNEVIEKSFNELMRKTSTGELPRNAEKEIESIIIKNTKKWLVSPVPEAAGSTPWEYFNSINNFEKLIDVFVIGSKVCDADLPGILKEKLSSFGDQAEEEMIKISSDPSKLDNDNSEDLPVVIEAIQLLGEWKCVGAVSHLINIMLNFGDGNDLLMETLQTSLTLIGKAMHEPVLDVLEGADEINPPLLHLFLALKDSGKNSKSDRIYECLKNTFRKMDNKVLGAMCLGDYGDGRAIPALRGFVKSHRDELNRETYYEIKRTIIRLGGDAEDL